MKKALLLLTVALLVGCTCLGQLPPVKYVIADTITCQAIVPDVLPFVSATAPCSDVVSLTQSPAAGSAFLTEVLLTVFAVTDQGVESNKNLRLVAVYNDSARITFDDELFVYNDPEVFDFIEIANIWAYNHPARFLTAVDTAGYLSYMEWKTVAIQPYMEDSVFWYADVRVNDFYEYVRLTYLIE